MSNTTEALKKMVETSMESVRWGLIALDGQANEHLEALTDARDRAELAKAKADEAVSSIDAQINRTKEFIGIQNASLSAIVKALDLVGGVKQ